MAQFLLELLSEEIPARMQLGAKADLEAFFTKRLGEMGLAFQEITSFVGPRRLGLAIDGLPFQAEDTTEERKGPRLDAASAAIEGFLKSTGLMLDECLIQETPKGSFYVATIRKKGAATAIVLADILGEFLKTYRWSKSMTWGNTTFFWVRPLRGIMALFDGKPLNFTLALGREDPRDLHAGNWTVGHRFLSSASIPITDFKGYKKMLHQNYVVVEDGVRRDMIREQLLQTGEKLGVTVKITEGLLNEVAGLVEWPVVYAGRIEQRFMELPAELLETTMRVHQRYFPTLDAQGIIQPHFLVVANHPGSDGGKAIIHGNERVLQARFSDAAFYWDLDRKQSLEAFSARLKDRIFHAQLGTLQDRVSRLSQLVEAPTLKGLVSRESELFLVRAAALCKADLCSGMVSEFPELQGVMGKYYALYQGEDPCVAQAIEDHYAPQGPHDQCPTAPVSVLLALADKMDALVGFFGIGMVPTGSKDPFALRRAALGVIRLIRENALTLSLRVLIQESMATYGFKKADLASTLLAFFVERLKVYLKTEDIRHDVINAALGDHWDGDIKRLIDVAHLLRDFLETEAGAVVVSAYRRATNIVRIEEKREGRTYGGTVSPQLFEQEEERVLYQVLSSLGGQEATRDITVFAGRVQTIAAIQDPLAQFFDHVTVNCPEKIVQENRLKLLAMLRTTLDSLADFSKLEA